MSNSYQNEIGIGEEIIFFEFDLTSIFLPIFEFEIPSSKLKIFSPFLIICFKFEFGFNGDLIETDSSVRYKELLAL